MHCSSSLPSPVSPTREGALWGETYAPAAKRPAKVKKTPLQAREEDRNSVEGFGKAEQQARSERASKGEAHGARENAIFQGILALPPVLPLHGAPPMNTRDCGQNCKRGDNDRLLHPDGCRNSAGAWLRSRHLE